MDRPLRVAELGFVDGRDARDAGAGLDADAFLVAAAFRVFVVARLFAATGFFFATAFFFAGARFAGADLPDLACVDFLMEGFFLLAFLDNGMVD